MMIYRKFYSDTIMKHDKKILSDKFLKHPAFRVCDKRKHKVIGVVAWNGSQNEYVFQTQNGAYVTKNQLDNIGEFIEMVSINDLRDDDLVWRV